MSDKEGKSTESFQKALEDAGKKAAEGPHTVTAITVVVGNPSIKEYRVKITPGG